LELKPNTVAKFLEIDNRGNIQPDTIFIANEYFLFKIFDTETIDGKEYVIIKYPDFNGKTNNEKIKFYFIIGATEKESKTGAVRVELSEKYNGKMLCITQEDFKKLSVTNIYRRNTHITGGILTLPFKFRKKIGQTPSSMTTDVTLGSYIGLRKRLAKKSDFFLTVPVTLGLTFINVSSNNTSPVNPTQDNAIVPGFTFGCGLVFQIDKFEFGLITGWDFGTGKAGTDWIYNKKNWVSFAIGYSFLN
jgi:hypothetical protein